MTIINEQINTVVDARERAKEATAQRTEAYRNWEKAHQSLFDKESIARLECQEAEDKLRELTLQAFVNTGNKTPAPGVGIRVMKRLVYDDKEALDWAVEHSIALVLNKKAFEKIAQASGLDFVTITDEPAATIATELIKVKED